MRTFDSEISDLPDKRFSHPAKPQRICRNSPRPQVRMNLVHVRNLEKVLVVRMKGSTEAVA